MVALEETDDKVHSMDDAGDGWWMIWCSVSATFFYMKQLATKCFLAVMWFKCSEASSFFYVKCSMLSYLKYLMCKKKKRLIQSLYIFLASMKWQCPADTCGMTWHQSVVLRSAGQVGLRIILVSLTPVAESSLSFALGGGMWWWACRMEAFI